MLYILPLYPNGAPEQLQTADIPCGSHQHVCAQAGAQQHSNMAIQLQWRLCCLVLPDAAVMLMGPFSTVSCIRVQIGLALLGFRLAAFRVTCPSGGAGPGAKVLAA